MSADEGVETAELLLCAKTLRRPILPVLRYSKKLPHHLLSLRWQHTGRSRSVAVRDEPGEAPGRRQVVHECWKTRLIDGVSDVLFHDVVVDVRDCLLELHEQQNEVAGKASDVQYEAQRGLFSAEQQSLDGPQNTETTEEQQRTAEIGNLSQHEHLPPSPPTLQQQERQHNRSEDVAVFPELLSARLSLLSADLAAINQRVATLERATGRGSGGAFTMGSLEGRVAVLEAAAVSAPPPAELAARVTELEHRMHKAGDTGVNAEPVWDVHTGPHNFKLTPSVAFWV